MLTLIDRNGTRERPICVECRKFHRPENCPKLRAKKRRKRLADKRFFEGLIAYREALEAAREARQA
jgi:hypothetical protein